MKPVALIAVCCVCGRARHGYGWGPWTPHPAIAASHTYCPECMAIAMKELDMHSRRGNVPHPGTAA